MRALVVGFGPFLTILDNPAARLARAVDGTGRRMEIVGREMPVSYQRSVATTLDLIDVHDPDWVLGIGVARRRSVAAFERQARCRWSAETPDVDGACGPLSGPDVLASTLDLSAALGLVGSEDAGAYVCNGWLHTMLQHTDRPLGFFHIPPTGFPAPRLVTALESLVPRPGRVGSGRVRTTERTG